MAWEAIKFTGAAGAFLGALSYGYSKLPFMLFVFSVILLILAFANSVEVV